MPPTIRQRLASWFARDDVRQLRAKAQILDRMAKEGNAWQPWLSANPQVLREFMMDQETLDFLTMQMQWESLAGQAGTDEQARQNTVNLSRYYYRSDPTVWRLIRIVTDFSIGRTIRVTCEDEKAQPVWDAFWTNPANRVLLSPQGIKRLSDIWLVDGEFIPVFYVAKVDGEVRVRRFPTEEIVEVLSDPDDQDAVIAYKRVWTPTNPQGAAGQRTLYYRDWRATAKDVKKLQLPNDAEWAGDNATEVSVMLGAVNTTSNRGWPWASRSMGWAQVYADFMKDRAAVASSVALWVREMKVKGGGSKGVEALRDMLRSTLATGDTETNPPPAAGSTLITNPAVDVTEKPLNTGAGDAAADSEMFANMAGSGANIAPFWLGHARSTANYATAQIIAQPMYEMFAGYTESWRGMIQDWADLVLGAWEKYGRREGMKSTEKFESHEATVYMGVPSSIPFEVLMSGIGTLAQFQAVPAKALADIALKHPAFGLEDPEKFLAPYLEEEKKKKEEEAQAQQQLGQQAPEEEPKNIVGVPGRPPAEKPEASAQGTGQGAEPEEEPTTEAQPPTCERGLSRIESEAMLEAAARVLAQETWAAMEGQEDLEEGGPGSGNWGHAGIKGHHGGSLPTGGLKGTTEFKMKGMAWQKFKDAYGGGGDEESYDAAYAAYTKWRDESGKSADLPQAQMTADKGATAQARHDAVASGAVSVQKKADVGDIAEATGKDGTAIGKKLIMGELTPEARKSLYMDDGITVSGETGTDSSSLGAIKATIAVSLSKKTGMDANTASDTIHQWANSSNDYSLRSLSIQADVATVFAGRGVKLSEFQVHRIAAVEKQSGHKLSSDLSRVCGSAKAQRDFVQRMYDNTQKVFAKMGLKADDYITLYRGIALPGAKLKRGANAVYKGNPAESWTTNIEAAKSFASMQSGLGKGDNYLLTAKIRVGDILSTCRTGFGCYHCGGVNEHEMVVLGVPRNVKVA